MPIVHGRVTDLMLFFQRKVNKDLDNWSALSESANNKVLFEKVGI